MRIDLSIAKRIKAHSLKGAEVGLVDLRVVGADIDSVWHLVEVEVALAHVTDSVNWKRILCENILERI